MEKAALTEGLSRKRRRSDKDVKIGRRRSACQTCRLRKIGCDRVRPECSLCRSSGSDCIYLNDPSEEVTLESVADTLTGRLDVVTRQLEELKAAVSSKATSLHPPEVTSPQPDNPILPQPSRDFSHIPPHRTTADTVLTWPIFENRYDDNYLIQTLLGINDPSQDLNVAEMEDDIYAMASSQPPLEEERIPALVDKFLQNVHTKNPILDVEALVMKGRECAKHGLGWNAWSCLLLLACALGHIAKPFGSEESPGDGTAGLYSKQMIEISMRKELQQGENCFVLACRRIGLLKPTIMAAQCYFYAGVYLMYTLRPMLSWQHFHQASITYQLYLKTNGRLAADFSILESTPHHLASYRARKESRLEQRLYWSCFKSECEFRVELPLPQSEIAQYDFPNLFPSPPSPHSPTATDAGTIDAEIPSLIDHTLATSPLASQLLPLEGESSVRYHAKKLCNEEESWYYYLTEVALRRIGNRVINTFFTLDRQNWIHIEPYLDIAVEFEAQVSSWSANLPPAMQRYETNSTIRAPQSAALDGVEAGFVSQELSWATENRLLEMRSWLYQPFLYYLVHVRPTRPGDGKDGAHGTRLSHEASGVLWSFIMRGIECNLTILDTRSLPHRHHGLWYDLRATMCASLILLAVVKSGYIDLIPGGATELMGSWSERALSPAQHNNDQLLGTAGTSQIPPIGGKFGKVLASFRLWSPESPDMFKHAEVLEHLIREIMISRTQSS